MRNQSNLKSQRVMTRNRWEWISRGIVSFLHLLHHFCRRRRHVRLPTDFVVVLVVVTAAVVVVVIVVLVTHRYRRRCRCYFCYSFDRTWRIWYLYNSFGCVDVAQLVSIKESINEGCKTLKFPCQGSELILIWFPGVRTFEHKPNDRDTREPRCFNGRYKNGPIFSSIYLRGRLQRRRGIKRSPVISYPFKWPAVLPYHRSRLACSSFFP